jgi:hypothetical protein
LWLKKARQTKVTPSEQEPGGFHCAVSPGMEKCQSHRDHQN